MKKVRFSIDRPTFQQKAEWVDQSMVPQKSTGLQTMDPSIPKIRKIVREANKNLPVRVPKLPPPPPSIGQNHPEETLQVPEQLRKGTSNVSSFLPKTRNRVL